MIKSHFILTPRIGLENKIEVEGHDLTNITSALQIRMSAGQIPEVTLEVYALSCEINTEGFVYFDSTGIPDEYAREIYETLKKRFET